MVLIGRKERTQILPKFTLGLGSPNPNSYIGACRVWSNSANEKLKAKKGVAGKISDHEEKCLKEWKTKRRRK